MQEDSILNEVVEIEIDRWCADPDEYLGAQKKELKSQVHFRDWNYIFVVEWNIVMQSLKNRKSPCPDSMSY